MCQVNYYHDQAHVLLLNGRLTFVGHTQPYPKDCALLLYSLAGRQRYDVWTWPDPNDRPAIAPRDRDSALTKTLDGCRYTLELSAEEVEGIAEGMLSEQLMAHARGMLVLGASQWPKDERITFEDVGRDVRKTA